jgi:GTPase
MASTIFTYDPDPPPVDSPWLRPEDSKNSRRKEDQAYEKSLERLEPEPQDGPIEYKLHLLLRPRRDYETISTTTKVSGSQQSRSSRPSRPNKSTARASPASSSHTRQNRLQHLTTQLLWRLQQSSPYHATTKGDLVIPRLPEDNEDLDVLQKPRKLLRSLEGSRGALYEIGVADDGTFVGLTTDEMNESMTTLKVMAASLGCRIDVQRMKTVGSCKWLPASGPSDDQRAENCVTEDLWVAEALVSPIVLSVNGHDENHTSTPTGSLAPALEEGNLKAEQLRVSFIGPTTSGKTTLLGTLVKGVLDNGRGSSRLNLLKHRHELVSGQTSSVTQELIGYKDKNIFNQAGANIESWNDIHERSKGGRLVFFSDSAGHIRFRRTTLRGLVGWAPHWTLLCISAIDDGGPTRGGHSLSGVTDDLGGMSGGTDLSLAHLDLCLRLEIPLVVVMTKFDLVANTSHLKDLLNPILSRIKAAGRGTRLLVPKQPEDAGMTEIPTKDLETVGQCIAEMASEDSNLSVVPIVFTSAVNGRGIGMVHALLHSLPMPPTPTARDYAPHVLNPEQPAALFHIDDTYEPRSLHTLHASGQGLHDSAIVVAGYLRFGKMTVGDKILVGPFPAEGSDGYELMPRDHPSPGYDMFMSHASSTRSTVSAAAIKGEWRNATIISIHNLRLRVQTMGAGQAGTIQILFDNVADDSTSDDALFERPKLPNVTIRKGQVLAIPSQHMLDTRLSLQAATGLKAVFKDSKALEFPIGTPVNIYVATVRAAGKIRHISPIESVRNSQATAGEESGDMFDVDDRMELEPRREASMDVSATEWAITLELLNHREWIELGSTVVLMEGNKNNSVSFYGYVGKVIEIAE